ncbi:hypothetical protein [Psychrobacter sp. I-STPA10]|uniref:hypothetical protein n=1 Tax=Psychrobacter sp. I-STPA10 TaxID=2585769 RepID=UPI001E3EFF92|nr:hypothetical protein [Psychrobacter sp. I-STPA10]
MRYRFGFWTFWVVVNAIASFVWAIFLDNSIPYILGMLVGIACFVVAYTLLDGYLLKHQHKTAHKALITGVYIKAGLQLLNFGFFIQMPIIPEIWAGAAAMTLLESFINPNNQPFLFALLATLLTGFFLSLLVGVISLIVGLVQSKGQSKGQSK